MLMTNIVDLKDFENLIKETFKKLVDLSLFESLYTDPKTFKVPTFDEEYIIKLSNIAIELQKNLTEQNINDYYEILKGKQPLSESASVTSQAKPIPENAEKFVNLFKMENELLSCSLQKLYDISNLCSKTLLPASRFEDLSLRPETSIDLLKLIESFSFFSLSIFGKYTARNISSLEFSKL